MNYKILAIFVLTLVLFTGTAALVSADGGIRYVAPSGSDTSDCTNSAFPCATVQYAVDQADAGDEVRVATGTYTGINDLGGLSQIVYISQTVTVRGGFTTGNWDVPDAGSNPTTLDAQGGGRILYITGNVSPTIEGLHVTGGDATGLGGGPSGYDAGGGVYAASTALTIDDCWIFSNTVSSSDMERVYGYGGGLYLAGDVVTLTHSTVTSNTISVSTTQSGYVNNYAYGYGGGLYVDSRAMLADNVVAGNTISVSPFGSTGNTNGYAYGGGIYLRGSGITLDDNTITGNTLSALVSAERNYVRGYGYGGGLYAYGDGITLTGNLVAQNTISASSTGGYYGYAHAMGGGLYLGDDAMLSGNTVAQNAARASVSAMTVETVYSHGGGLYVKMGGTLTGNTIEHNQAGHGGGLYLASNTPHLAANTVAHNTATSDGGGLYQGVVDSTLSANLIHDNTALGDGGGFYVQTGSTALSGNVVARNQAGSDGGALYLGDAGGAGFTLDNTVVVDNHAGGRGSGLYVKRSATLRHTTIARNTGGDESGVHIAGGTSYLTNTIIAGHTTGITVASGTANLDHTLWHGNGSNWGGEGTIWHGNDLSGDPAFAPDGYHLTDSSMAVNRGADAGVETDVDGERRPIGDGYEIGADEHAPACFARVSDGVNDGPILHSVQSAIDAASPISDVVKVAGTCSAVETRSGFTQIAYVTQSLTLQGGYTTTNWAAPDPQAFPTTLDAQDQGRVIYVAGSIAVTVDGFHVTNGSGGGIYVSQATVTIRDNEIYDNQAASGGGIGLVLANSVLVHNQIYSNTVTGGGYVRGGGVYIYGGDGVLTGNVIRDNTASGTSQGGGIYGGGATITLDGNTISGNQALVSGRGGGVYWYRASGVIRHNRIVGNEAHSSYQGEGGGVYLYNTMPPGSSATTLDANFIARNTATGGGSYGGGYGGGIACQRETFVMTNDVVVENSASTDGGGILLRGCRVDMMHDTIARNTGGSGRGIDARLYYNGSTVHLTNTIVASQTVGVYVDSYSAATLDTMLWGTGDWDNGTDWTGSNVVTANDLWGDPAFADSDYHIAEGSDALDRGIDVGLVYDVDGHPRPLGPGYDVGADEFGVVLTITKSAATGVVGTPLTYTLAVSNTGQQVATGVVVTDAVPVGASYLSGGVESNGVVTWSGLTVGAGRVTTATFAVTTCQASLTNEWYRVLTSTGGVTTAWGVPLVTDLIPPEIDANFDHSPAVAGVGKTVFFADVTDTSGGPIVTRRWDFGDGSAHTFTQNASHTYATSGTYTVTLAVTDTCGYTAATSRTVYVTGTPFIPIYGVDLAPSSMAASGNPGDDVTYNLWITNTGNVTDAFDVDIEGNEWMSAVEPTVVDLQPSEMRDVTVTVSVASAAQCGETDVVTVTVTSRISPTTKESSVLTTSANTVSGVALYPSVSARSGAPGEMVTHTLRVTNTGNCPNSFNVAVDNNIWDTMPSITGTGSLAPGAGLDVDVWVTIPLTATDGANETVTVVVTSQGDGTALATGVLTTTAVQEQLCTELTGINIAGDSDGYPGIYTFTTHYEPVSATEPIAYLWDDGGTDASTVRTLDEGAHTLAVTATNCDGTQVVDTHTITISAPPVCTGITDVEIAGQETGHVGADYVFSAHITPSNATPLVSYTWSPAPAQGQDTSTVTYEWGMTGTYTITVTVTNCNGMVSSVHSITIEPVRIYLPLVTRNYAGEMTRHELEDAPDTCPGHGIEVGNHLYLDDFDRLNDHDWYSFEAIAGRTYTLQTSELELRADTSMELYADDCVTILAENDDVAWPDDVASRIVWTAPADGTYHASVRSYDWQVHGNDTGYTFGVRLGAEVDMDLAPKSTLNAPVKPSPPARPEEK